MSLISTPKASSPRVDHLGGGWGVAWDQEHSRVEAAPPRAHRAILRLLKTTGHVMPRAALHIGRWSPCSPVRGDSPLLVCGAVPPRRQSGRGQLQQTGRAAPGAGHSQRSAGACKSSTPVVPVQRTESWGCSVQGAASPEGAGGPARGLRGPSAECPPRATGPHGAWGGSPRPCLPGLGTCRPGPPQARRLVTSSAPPAPLWHTPAKLHSQWNMG